MDSNVVECEVAERESCGCRGGPTLDILRDVQRAYEERMQLIERVGGSNKLQMQVDVLRSWVSDVVGQNTLLVRAVEQLETEAINLLVERRRHSEQDKKWKVSADWSELLILNDSLQKENTAKDREIQRLNKDIQQYERTIINLRNKVSLRESSETEILKKDAEVMAGLCCTGNECGDWEPVMDYNSQLDEEAPMYQDRIKKMSAKLKSSSDSIRTLRKMNVAFKKEMDSMRGVCTALHDQCLAASTELQFKDELIKEMRRQLRKAKAKIKEISGLHSLESQNDYLSGDNDFGQSSALSAYESVVIECVSHQPGHSHSAAGGLKFDGSGDDVSVQPD
ncbi:uncharacterized protein LOC131852342 [Achroia grisella]|uniref:uncharacterized protein LOC131852342 n=1 Tax=Achroia grisella TaxID=688607 RepID=UPI0027D242EF|nr:uncharacterized protein LOC131852342 [Achroia grisella]